MAGGEPRFGTLSTYMALSMPRLPRQSQQNSLVYMGMVSRGNPPDNEPNQSLAAPSNKKLRLGDVLRWRIGDLDAVSECDALDDFGQLVFALQPAPGFGRCHDQLEHGAKLSPEFREVHRALHNVVVRPLRLDRPDRSLRSERRENPLVGYRGTQRKH